MRHRLDRRDRGAVLPLVALVLVSLVAFTALAIDLGYERLVRRDLQAVADVVSLDLARRLDGSTVDQLDGSSSFQAALTESRARNDFAPAPGRTLTYRLGTVDATTRVFTAMSGSQVPTAVEVTATDAQVERWFSTGSGSTTRTAIATLDATTDFWVGSFLAGTDPNLSSGLLNRILPRLLGSSVDDLGLTAVGYRGLADAYIPLGPLATALGVGSPEALVDGSVYNARDVYLATASVLTAQGGAGNLAAATVLNRLATEVGGSAQIDLSDWLGADVGSGGSAAGAAVNVPQVVPALPFVTGTASIINGTNLVSIPNLNVGIPGVVDADVELRIVRGPEFCWGCKAGDHAETSQMELVIRPELNIGTSTLTALGIPFNPVALLADVRVQGNLEISVDIAGARATLDDVACAQQSTTLTPGIQVSVTTSPIDTAVSSDLDVRARVLGAMVSVADVAVTGQPAVASGTAGPPLTFVHTAEFGEPDGTADPKRVGSPQLNLQAPLQANASNTTLLGLPLGPTLPAVTTSVNVLLNPVVNLIDSYIVASLTRTLGLSVAGADVGAMHLECSSPALVG